MPAALHTRASHPTSLRYSVTASQAGHPYAASANPAYAAAAPPVPPYPMYHTRPCLTVRSKRISPPTATHSTDLTLLVLVLFVRDTRSKHRAYCYLYMLNTNGPSSWGCCSRFFPFPPFNVTRASQAADGASPFFFQHSCDGASTPPVRYCTHTSRIVLYM